MSFYKILQKYKDLDIESYFGSISEKEIQNTLNKSNLDHFDFLNLISPKAHRFTDIMAQKAHKMTIQYFGRAIGLYIPIYLANYCENNCLYCGFRKDNQIPRKVLDPEEMKTIAESVFNTGMRHVLLLTGEDRSKTSIDYILEAVRIFKAYFSSVSIEIFPMEVDEYSLLKNEGVDGLTIYQETYDEGTYKRLHSEGAKSDYSFRLDTPERGAKAKFRAITIGPLLGLGNAAREVFFTALHAKYLSNKYLDTEFNISLPRLSRAEGNFESEEHISDKDLVQFILAFRLFLPRSGIVISTRERAELRDNLIPLGITRMSAGSKTFVGGYIEKTKGISQFELSDNRDIPSVINAIIKKGYDPVFKDWDTI